MNIYLKVINLNYITRVGADIKRVDLFNISTKVYVIDPSIFSPAVIYSSAAVSASQVVYTTDFSQVAENVLNTNWTLGGWDVTSQSAFSTELKTWADNNLPVTVPGYNLIICKVPFEEQPVLSYINTSLIDFTYDSITGVVSYIGSPDLAPVQIGHKFRDSTDTYFNIIGVDDTLKTITIRNDLNAIPASISLTIVDELAGAAFINIPGSIQNYSIAFFYAGNQGTLMP